VQNTVQPVSDMTAPHPALPGDTGGLEPDEVLAGLGHSELVDAGRHGAAGPAAESREARALRHPVDLEVVILDNGSVDDTAASVLAVDGRACNVVTGWCVEVVAIGGSRAGKGAAVHRGLRTSRSRFVGFTDADLSTPLETFLPVMAALSHGAAAAIGSRHAPGARIAGRQPLGRRLGGTAFRALSRPLLPGVHDTQCGFKFFDRTAVQPALWRSRSTGFAFDIELLRHVRDDGGRIVEIPVTWTDAAGSTLRPVRDGLAAFGAVAQLHRQLGGAGPAPRPHLPSSTTASPVRRARAAQTAGSPA
jgi:dolichyl-phosphate beta-glucosyltransferase